MFLLLGKQGLGVIELHLQAAVSRLQLGNDFLRVGLFQLDDTATQGAQVKEHVLRDLGQRVGIHHADR